MCDPRSLQHEHCPSNNVTGPSQEICNFVQAPMLHRASPHVIFALSRLRYLGLPAGASSTNISIPRPDPGVGRG